MSALTTRAGKGSPLTNTEVDTNFNNLNNDKLETVHETDLVLADIATGNVSITKHGLTPKLSGIAAQFLNGEGNFATPSGLTIINSYSLTSFTAQTSINIVHNYGTYPVVQIMDNSGAVMIPKTTVHNTINDFTVTFSSATSGQILATVGSPQPQQVISVSDNYTTLATDKIIKMTVAGKTTTLISAIDRGGLEYKIHNASSGMCYVNTTSSQTISEELIQSLPAKSAMTVYSDGANYWII